jgi:uncharacterized protein YjiS (DUF1127 family)
MSFRQSFVSYASSLLRNSRERRARRQTYEAVSELPTHILKDIGWPDSYNRRVMR